MFGLIRASIILPAKHSTVILRSRALRGVSKDGRLRLWPILRGSPKMASTSG
jgi:hypothetical protein